MRKWRDLQSLRLHSILIKMKLKEDKSNSVRKEKYAKERANGVCQICGQDTPLKDKDGNRIWNITTLFGYQREDRNVVLIDYTVCKQTILFS